MISIDVVSESNLWNKKIKKPNIFFNNLINFFPKNYRFVKKKVSLTILLSNNKNIKKLNKRFRNKNRSTDILSFPFEKKLNIKKSPYIGDIVISYEYMNIWMGENRDCFIFNLRNGRYIPLPPGVTYSSGPR